MEVGEVGTEVTPLVIGIDEPAGLIPRLVGGKASSLARLRQSTIAVPEFLVVSSASMRAHLDACGISSAAATSINPALLAATMETIRAATFPPRVGDRVLAAYHALPRSTGLPTVAVRSSAVGEDSAEASFAGQFDSYLGVHGDDLVLQRIKDCWSAYFNERAALYRQSHPALGTAGAQMGVVVQRQIFATKAGVLFTAHPITRHPQQLYAEANFGTAESVVSGLVTPDAVTFGRSPLAVIDYQVSVKTAMSVVSAGTPASRMVATPQVLTCQRVLTDREALELARIAVDVERQLGGAQDIEWAIDDERVWIIQARPVTSPRPPAVPPPGSLV